MATSVTLHSLQGSILRSHFIGRDDLIQHSRKQSFTIHKSPKTHSIKPCAKFNLSEILGGRGLCNGEQGLQEELKRDVDDDLTPVIDKAKEDSGTVPLAVDKVSEDAFEKELMGLTGGFPGGEKGLKRFVEENPPPQKPTAGASEITDLTTSKKPKPPELPLLMPGMIAIVKNSNNPYYMYCGIVQRITDGKAGVLFEGGNWDRLITFRLEELERREKGPPMRNPRKNSVSDEKIELKEPYVTKFVYRDELNKKPPSPSKVKKSVRFENSEPKILGEEDVENSFQKTSCGDHTVDNEKGMIRVKVRMTKQEAARMLSKCKGEGVLEFKDVAGDLVSVPINRFSIM